MGTLIVMFWPNFYYELHFLYVERLMLSDNICFLTARERFCEALMLAYQLHIHNHFWCLLRKEINPVVSETYFT